jgi:hypothetical protein
MDGKIFKSKIKSNFLAEQVLKYPSNEEPVSPHPRYTGTRVTSSFFGINP